ncbi:putative transporter permease [Magnetofaba australis IT-1]|uniref:Putative transporter permease n=2 Tax=Magnetofaba TaxID=1472292 RepID=A0A1Y2K2T1_9PROT|nr:putative transporter permease [Magnetofaba australis IT-1]
MLAFMLCAALLASLAHGSVAMSLGESWRALLGQGDALHQELIWSLRLPRALAAVAAGGLLALAGALLQVLLRNPLADPFVLGVSGGAASAALLALLLGAAAWVVEIASLGGAFLAMTLVFGLARARGAWSPTRLLLTGVVMAAGWGALINLLLAISPDAHLKGMLFWLMGDLDNAEHPGWALAALALGLLLIWPQARALNLLARGDNHAAALGVSTGALRILLYLIASLLTAAAVTTAGSVGFVGLVTPHLLRLAGLRDNRLLLPACALGGATLLLLADLLARVAIAPQQLPVGVITAFLGVPLFLILMRREGGQ